jgi:hypothetical protein
VVFLLENALRKSNAGPVKVQAVLDMLHTRAIVLEDVKAAQLYLQAVDRLAPRRVEVTHTDASGLSNEQLAYELRRALDLIHDHSDIVDAESSRMRTFPLGNSQRKVTDVRVTFTQRGPSPWPNPREQVEYDDRVAANAQHSPESEAYFTEKAGENWDYVEPPAGTDPPARSATKSDAKHKP